MRAFAKFAVVLLWISGISVAAENDVRFDIVRFQVDGNTLLTSGDIQSAVTPFIGRQRVYGDVQQALEALEAAYRKAGYGTVQVYVPEQELTSGVVQLRVTEGVIDKVTVIGNKYFDEANVRAGLPALKEGKAPNMRELSENIQLSNENPAKQVEVTLGVSEEEGKVNAKVSVAEENPQRVFISFDNTGNAATGNFRLGVAYQNANLFDLDQTLTLAYTSSPDSPAGVKVDIFSVGYRVPIYALGDSLDFIYGNSNINTPSSSPTLGAGLAINGRGSVWGVRFNHYFPRQGEYSSKLIGGLDYKYMNTRCSSLVILGAPAPIDPPAPENTSCTPYSTRPLSIAYAGKRERVEETLDYNISFYRNIPLGVTYNANDLLGMPLGMDRYTAVSGSRQVPDGFSYLKFSGSYARLLPGDWQARVAFNAQYSPTPLPQLEQLGLAGSQAVRGFHERAVAMDKGWFANLEAYSPDFASTFNIPGSLRGVLFYDLGGGFNYATVRPNDYTTPVEKASIASVGLGLRYGLRKDVSVRLDVAQVVDAGPLNIAPGSVYPIDVSHSNTESRGDWRGHLNVIVGF